MTDHATHTVSPSPVAEARLLPDSPTDGITRLVYLPPAAVVSSSTTGAAESSSTSLLASTSWDGHVRVHDTHAGTLQRSHYMESGPLLSLTPIYHSSATLATGGLDGSIQLLDLASSAPPLGVGRQVLGEGSHGSVGVSCLVSWPSQPSVMASAGYHRQFHLWDLRLPSQRRSSSSSTSWPPPALTIPLPGKAFAMDASTDPLSGQARAVVATSDRRICVLDIRTASAVEPPAEWSADLRLNREASLKYQLRTVRFFPTGDALAVGSIEGRVAVEYLEELQIPAAGKKYAFKCHRVGEVVYPVNCIEFHPRFGTFATGGCDGTVVLWDGISKKKLTTLPKFPTSIAALAFNHDGTELAIASSYTFEEGEREHPRDEIYVRPVLDSEAMPKSA